MFLPSRNANQEWLGVVIAIPEPWVSQLTSARLELGDKEGAKVPAHITIMPPLAVDGSEKEAVIEHLRSIASRCHPFRVTLGGFGTFQPISPVVYLRISEGASQCIDLAEDVRSGPLDHPLRFPYHPHVTLAQGLASERTEDAEKIGNDFEASWMVPGFRLDRVDDNGVYNSMALFDFGL